jgi:chromosome partitioning protein
MEAADLVLIPCRPSAFDLAAIQTTAQLVKSVRKHAYVVFTAGAPNAPRMDEEVSELVEGFGVKACPYPMSDRAAYRHASAEGKTAQEIAPKGKAAQEIQQICKWVCGLVVKTTSKKNGRAAA